ncbi:conserved hypothetical protein [Agrobacterium tumefaciens str. Kerr 14]|uniref:Uncharacterized protein n=1 Tax=Agrobacterium tumefaciens str. Kerr 14 TaxID=1183424 RepID=A0A1S7S5L9_AGRTU|nr:hypothetical protein ATCR1_07529 [Agrobacterium tumefaciens CCNWGS0286]CUX62830.1 conserved hypothetical protein [Agrobacterium tumefaciens str. Kerr 14]
MSRLRYHHICLQPLQTVFDYFAIVGTPIVFHFPASEL